MTLARSSSTVTCAGMCAQVLRQFMLLSEGEIRELESLAARVVSAEAEKVAEEELLQVSNEQQCWFASSPFTSTYNCACSLSL